MTLRNRLTFAGIVLTVGLALSPANAQQGADMTFTGRELLEALSRPNMDWVNFTNGYVQAAYDAMFETGPPAGFCPPSGLARAQIATDVQAALLVVPELLDMQAITVVKVVLLSV